MERDLCSYTKTTYALSARAAEDAEVKLRMLALQVSAARRMKLEDLKAPYRCLLSFGRRRTLPCDPRESFPRAFRSR